MIQKHKKIQLIGGKGLWVEAIYPWDLLHLNELVLKKCPSTVAGTIEKGVQIKGNVLVGKESIIHSGSYIVGPAVIGEGCEIGPNACIFPSTTVGNNSTIHPFCEIRNSVIMDDAHIGSNSFISHSIIGRGSVIGHNFCSISGKTTVEVEDEFKKLANMGVMIGEDCTIGSNVVIEAGIKIGRGCEINPLKRIINNVSSKSKVM